MVASTALALRSGTPKALAEVADRARMVPSPSPPPSPRTPPPAPPMLKLAYGLKYEGVWRPTRMWEALVVVAVTNAMQDARLSRADAWTIRS